MSTAAAAALAGLPVTETRQVLTALARAHLAEAASGVDGRWRMHDLLRLYAQRLSNDHSEADEREQARDRLLDYYFDMADAANDHLQVLPEMAMPSEFTGRDDALAWLDAERPSLVAAVQMAADTGRNRVAYALPLVLSAYLAWRRRFDDWLSTSGVSLHAARRLGDPHNEGASLVNLGAALEKARRFEEAITACQEAATIYRETGDRHGQGTALNHVGVAQQGARRFEEAITAHQDAAAIFRETGDRHGAVKALNNLGGALAQVGRHR